MVLLLILTTTPGGDAMSSSFQRWAYWATGVELELAHGHEASNQDLNWHLGLKPSCFDHYTKSSKASPATEGHQLEQLSWHFIMFNSPTLRPFISPMYVCVCVCVFWPCLYWVLLIPTFLHTLPRIAQLSIPQASDVALQDPKSLLFPPDHNGWGSEHQREDQSLKSSLTYLTGSLWTK